MRPNSCHYLYLCYILTSECSDVYYLPVFAKVSLEMFSKYLETKQEHGNQGNILGIMTSYSYIWFTSELATNVGLENNNNFMTQHAASLYKLLLKAFSKHTTKSEHSKC